MKTYIKKLSFSVFATLGLISTSCSLNEYNPSAGDETIKSFSSWKGMQAYSYSPLNDQLYTASDWMFASEGGTDLWLAKGNGNSYRQDLNYELYTTSNNSTEKLWKQCYSMITNCNSVINEAGNIEDVGENEETVKVLVAETKVLRAFYNYLIVSNFGPVTLNLESSVPVSGIADVAPVRSSEKDFYDQIFKDLKEAAADLGVEPFEGNRARVTKKTALGLLCRAYAQRAGLGAKFGDAETYWRLAAETAEDLITNADSYGAYLYPDIADMWADANNRSNREALFVACGGDANSEAFTKTSQPNKLLAYSCGGYYNDMFAHDPTKNGQCYFYGRLNSQSWFPSKYLMYCFNPKWDRRWEYTWCYAPGDFSMVQCGWVAYDKGQKKLTESLCNKYGIDLAHAGKTFYPLADCDGKPSTFGGNQYPAKIWPKGDTSGDVSQLLEIPSSSSQIGQNGFHGATKAFVMPWPVAIDENRVNMLFTLERMSDEEKALCQYPVVCMEDMYGSNGLPYGNLDNGSEGGNPPAIGNGKTSNSAAPSLLKFNWSYDGVFSSNLQIKTGDMFIMRMAEIYLIAAEAEQMLGNGGKAANYLNVLRARAARQGVAESEWKLANATEEDILDEYARELCGEFTRWALLKRHNAFEDRLAKYNVRAAKSFRPYMYNRPVSSQFLSTILNDDEYGDNGYGQTPTSGLENVD